VVRSIYKGLSSILCTFLLVASAGCHRQSSEAKGSKFPELDTTGPIALSDDGQYIATVSSGSYPPNDGSSIVEIRNAQTTYPTGTMIRTSPVVRHVEFVSKEFGFLLARSPVIQQSDESSDRPISSLEQLALDGARKIIVDRIDDEIASMSVSSDHQLVAICTKPRAYAKENSQCYVFSIPNGREVSRFSSENAKRFMGVFVGMSRNIFLASDNSGGGPFGYLVDSGSGMVLQECFIERRGNFATEVVVACHATNDVFVSTIHGICRVDARLGVLTVEVIYDSIHSGSPLLSAMWIAVDPKGTFLAFGEREDGEYKSEGTQVIEISTGRHLKPILEMAGPMEFSPDGSWLYFARQRVQVQKLR
jgi:hypothetical protein